MTFRLLRNSSGKEKTKTALSDGSAIFVFLPMPFGK
jgi:hypothetical protein